MPYRDPEIKRARQAEYRATRREELAAKQRARYAALDKDHHQALAAAWRERNPERAKAVRFANTSNRRAREQGADGKLYARRDLVGPLALPGPCAYCASPADTWDHYNALCHGGPNTPANLRLVCTPCNRAKARRTPEAWERFRAQRLG